MKRLVTMAAALAVVLGGMGQARADQYLFQWDDAEPILTGNTYQNGVLIQSVPVGPEGYDGTYGLWFGVLIADLNVAVNIYDPDGITLSDTWLLSGQTGASFLTIPFHSDVEDVPLPPLPNPTLTLIETGDWQTVAEFAVSTGDVYTWQFRSDVDAPPVPEPATLTLLGFGGLALAGWRRMRNLG